MNKIIIEPDKVEEYKSDAIENICKNIANEMDLKVFKEQQELTKMWEEKYYQIKKERDKQKEVLDKISDNIDLELLKTRRNDDYNKGFFDGVISIKTTLEKLLEEIK